MSQADSESQPDKRAIALSRTKLVVLMAIYAAPLIAAWLWLGYVKSNEGAGVSVNGELIKPAVALTEFDLSKAEGVDWGLNGVKEKWSMLYFASDTCDEKCEQALYNMRQVRLSTGRRMDRVQRIVVTPQINELTQKLEQASEGLVVAGGARENIASLKMQVEAAEVNMAACDGCIYLIDPFGNLMMRFAPGLDPKKMLKDLKHLLKVSRIG